MGWSVVGRRGFGRVGRPRLYEDCGGGLPGGTVETMASGIAPNGIALGPDGNLWFTNYGNDSIGRITPIGVVTNYSGGSGIWAPYAITAAPDGNLWFANSLDNSIGRITAVEPPGAPTNAAVQPGTGRRR